MFLQGLVEQVCFSNDVQSIKSVDLLHGYDVIQ